MKVLPSLMVAFTFVLSSTMTAQEVWSLERCINYAMENNLTLRQGRLDVEQANINERASKQLRLPNLNGNGDLNLSFGRQVDPTSNDFVNQEFWSNSWGISGGAVLFNGGRINNQIRQSELFLEASELDVEQIENDMALNIANAYLTVLFAQENYLNAEHSLALIDAQLDQIEKFIEAGTRPQNARLDLVAQQAQSEQMLVNAQNEIDIGYLNLKQLLQLDGAYDMVVEVPDFTLPSDYDIAALDAENVYETAEAWQPNVKASAVRTSNAEIGVDLAKTAMIPTLSIGGSVNSRYSSFAQRQGDQIGTETVMQDIFINDEPITLSFEQPVYAFDKVPYGDQLNENLAFGFGLSLNVPIYNRGQNKANQELAELDVVRARIAQEQIKDNLKIDVQRAVADVKTGKEQYEAALHSAEANRAAYQDTEKRFDLGVANSLELVTAQSNRDQAETDLSIAKYQYIFRLKVLDYYLGKPITLD